MSETLCRSYIVAGQSVSFISADRWTIEKVERQVSGWHFSALADNPPTALPIRLSRDVAPAMPRGPSLFAVHRGECVAQDEALWLATGDSRLHVHPEGSIDVWIGEETVRTPVDFARVLFYATQAALRRRGLFELHAAALISPAESSGVLVAGASGSGKTTLAMRLAAAGWSNVADDLVLIRVSAPAAEAFAFRRVFAATQTTLDACAPPRIDEATREPNEFEPAKRRLDPQVLYPGTFAPSCTPRLLVFPSITGSSRTEFRHLSMPDALTRLLRMCPWAAYDGAVARAHLDALGLLARQCVSYALLAGSDLLYDSEAAPRLFGSLAGERQ